MRRVAAIDVGTNSVLLTVAEAGASGPQAVLELATVTRLGGGVDRSRRLSPQACDRTLEALSRYAAEIERAGAEQVAVVGTSALRDAEGADEFLAKVELTLGTRPRVIAGSEEAQLTCAGALSGLGLRGRVCVCDVGGGSTELIGGVTDQSAVSIQSAQSLDIGSVRLSERHLASDPPTANELTTLEAATQCALARVQAPAANTPLVGVGGTVTTLVTIVLEMRAYDSARVHGARLSTDVLTALKTRLASLPLASRRIVAGLEPARADVIVAGTSIVCCVLAWAGADELIVSDRGVRWGLVQQMLSS
jgi:exopolyphosphatase/guanosine-5'-triphosphate,3'-diphosphate pyrophosphatase